MSNIKLWSVLLPIVLTCINYENVAKAYKDVQLGDEFLLGGFVGCLYENVCVGSELCFNDHLFGKCVSRLNTSSVKTVWEISMLSALEDVFHMFPEGLDWKDLQVQCLFRTILQGKSDLLTETELKALCGLLPVIAADAPDNEEAEYSLLAKRMFDSEVSVETLLDNNHAGLLPFYSTNEKHNPTSSVFNDRALSAKLVQILKNNRMAKRINHPESNDRTDAEIKQILAQIQLLENESNRHIEFQPVNRPYNKQTVYTSREGGKQNRVKSATSSPSSVENLPKRRYQLSLSHDMKPPIPPTRSWIWAKFVRRSLDAYEAEYFLQELSRRLQLASPISNYFMDRTGNVLYFQVPKATGISTESVVQALKEGKGNFDSYQIEHVGFGRAAPLYQSTASSNSIKNYPVTLAICLAIVSVFVLLILSYIVCVCYRKWRNTRDEKASNKAVLIDIEHSGSRRRPSSQKSIIGRLKQLFEPKLNKEKSQLQKKKQLLPESIASPIKRSSNPSRSHHFPSRDSGDGCNTTVSSSTGQRKLSRTVQKDSISSTQSSTSSWSSEPVSCGIDLTTGHLILTYMEGFLRDAGRLTEDWEAVNAYEAEEATPCADAQRPENLLKNRITAPLPFEQSRVKLRNSDNDYINASLLYDHSPRNPSYIATPTPMLDTLSDFWEMVWEQNSVVIVCLERANELKQPKEVAAGGDNNLDASVQYWPKEGIQVYGNFEVHLVSEHNWRENYVVRSLYLKNLETSETRTVTQFHYLTWEDKNLKSKITSILEFRRKVNRAFRAMMSPIVIHCLDGSGRSGTYILLDLVITRIVKGVKEINIAASLEHLRDQRPNMVQSKEQYEFVFTAVAQEVDGMLKATGQNS